MPFTSTHATLPLRTEGIKITVLPRTFRDSVILVTSLGLQYMWIDSLCLSQDDVDDWARQAAQMAKVYQNAHLVSNAANLDSDLERFLNQRHQLDLVRTAYQLSLQLLPADEDRWPDTVLLDNLTGEPVNKRAWCLQERYLPTRASKYGTHQAFWQCESTRASEAGDAVVQDGSYLERLCQTANIKTLVSALSKDDELEAHNTHWMDWCNMIQNYTTRSITKLTDHLPALSGLVQATIRETGDSGYLSGIWKSGLLEGLMWCSSKSGVALPSTTEYVAPSWSWTAVLGAVWFLIYTSFDRRVRRRGQMTNFEPLAEYFSHTLEARDADAYVRLSEGSLTLRAPLLPVMKVLPKKEKKNELNDLFGLPPSFSEITDSVYQLRLGDGKKIWIEGGLLNAAAEMADTEQIFVLFLTSCVYT